MEWITGQAFILAMIMLTGACFVITYDVNLWGVRGPSPSAASADAQHYGKFSGGSARR